MGNLYLQYLFILRWLRCWILQPRMLLNKTAGEAYCPYFFPLCLRCLCAFMCYTVSTRCYWNLVTRFRIDSLSVLPASFTSQDANKILLLCPSVQSALKVVFWSNLITSQCSFAIDCWFIFYSGWESTYPGWILCHKQWVHKGNHMKWRVFLVVSFVFSNWLSLSELRLSLTY